MTLQDAMWRNEPDRMVKAKNQARMARNRGEYMSAHSIMLSAYITALGGKPVERHHPVKFFLLALWHALCMYKSWRELNHNQLDVLIQFLITVRKRLPLFPFRPNLVKLANREVGLTSGNPDVKAHQLALAYMTKAEAEYATHGVNARDLYQSLNLALNLDFRIRVEPDQPQGLRQLVRIYRKAGELKLALGDRAKAMEFFHKALELAKGKADAPDQAAKIEAFLPQEPR